MLKMQSIELAPYCDMQVEEVNSKWGGRTISFILWKWGGGQYKYWGGMHLCVTKEIEGVSKWWTRGVWCMQAPSVKNIFLELPPYQTNWDSSLHGHFAKVYIASYIHYRYNTPTCRITRELQCKLTKSEISLILEFKTWQAWKVFGCSGHGL